MQYGICSLSLVPVRLAPDTVSQMVTQALYGEHFKVLEQRKYHSKIRLAFDGCEGWIQNEQLTLIQQEHYTDLDERIREFSTDLVSFIETERRNLMSILLGSTISATQFLKHRFEGGKTSQTQDRSQLIKIALHYLDAPQLEGGKTPFGIDAAGFTQMVYKINGHRLLRSAQKQSTQGDALSFIEESEPGDLAFFDNQEGEIDHVGIIMEDNYIIHVNGKVRIDRLDHTGIFNAERGLYTHQLRVIKKLG